MDLEESYVAGRQREFLPYDWTIKLIIWNETFLDKSLKQMNEFT